MSLHDLSSEWLEADGLGGFASGTAGLVRTRRYHALLLAAARPPAERRVLVNGIEVRVRRDGESEPVALSSQRYAPDVIHPDGARRIATFDTAPWPRWVFDLGRGSRVIHELFVVRGAPITVLSWRAEGPATMELFVRPLISGRDFHALQRENPSLQFAAWPAEAGALRFRPYPGEPSILMRANGEYRHAPDWYRSFLYDEERRRGLDDLEDLASPGEFRWDLRAGEAFLVLGAEGPALDAFLRRTSEGLAPECLRRTEAARRARQAGPIDRATESYIVARGEGLTLIAGYPWFGDWGRDTFIALRGLCLATARLDDAGRILEAWSSAVSEGMLPNRFPDAGETPEYNSVDASLWYVVAAHEYLEACAATGREPRSERALRGAVEAILEGYSRGTRYGIRLDADGLLAAGEPGVQLTWMDARVGDRVITPRTGKPVEVQALWLNALRIAERWTSGWKRLAERGSRAFHERFWNADRGCLHDVVDVDHRPGTADPTVRPNQIFTVGGLPFPLLHGEKARAVVECVERELLTPLGLRSLAPGEPGYVPRYAGGVAERDGAYHQGTVWPWLLGPFVEAWLRVRGGSAAARAEAATRFLAPLREHLGRAGLDHVSEIADAEAPHAPAGCPFQAWSLGEMLRLERLLVVERGASVAPAAAKGTPRRRIQRTSHMKGNKETAP